MKKSKKAIIIITSIILVIGLLILSTPLIFSLLSIPSKLESNSVKHFIEYKEDYSVIANFAVTNIDVIKNSGYSGFAYNIDNLIRCGDDDFLELTEYEAASMANIRKGDLNSGISLENKLLAFVGMETYEPPLAYAYTGKRQMLCKVGANRYLTVKIDDNWYVLVEIPKL